MSNAVTNKPCFSFIRCLKAGLVGTHFKRYSARVHELSLRRTKKNVLSANPETKRESAEEKEGAIIGLVEVPSVTSVASKVSHLEYAFINKTLETPVPVVSPMFFLQVLHRTPPFLLLLFGMQISGMHL